MRIFPQVFHVDLQVGQKEFDFPFVLGLQKEAFIISRRSKVKSKWINESTAQTLGLLA